MVVVVEINTCNVISILAESNGIDTSRSFWELGSAFLFASDGIPGEEDWAGANLSGYGHFALVAKLDAHDIICVSRIIVGFLL